MNDQLAFTLTSSKPFAEVVANLEKHTPEHQFRVLHVHDVQATLAEKGLTRDPLKIIEVCNAGFAFNALQKDLNVALFMPCKFTVYTDGSRTIVNLARPTMISQMMPGAGLEKLAADVEATLIAVMKESV
jgi:uncharacterized protein (DUF302 family)